MGGYLGKAVSITWLTACDNLRAGQMLHNFFTKMSVKGKKKQYIFGGILLPHSKEKWLHGVHFWKRMVCIFLSLDDPLIGIEDGIEKMTLLCSLQGLTSGVFET